MMMGRSLKWHENVWVGMLADQEIELFIDTEVRLILPACNNQSVIAHLH